MGIVRVQLVDMVNGEPLTTPDQPAELDDTIKAADLVEQILSFVGQLPEGHLVEPKATKIVNKSRRAELTSQQTLSDVGTEDGDTLALYYSTVFGSGPTAPPQRRDNFNVCPARGLGSGSCRGTERA